MLRLTGEVAEQYLNLRVLDAESHLIEKGIKLRKTSLEIAQKRFQGGLTTESDVTRATSSLATAEAEAVDVLRRRGLIQNSLAELCGQAASTFRIDAKQSLPSHVPEVPLSSPASILRQRPDIAESERNVAARSADIGAAIGEQYPSLKLSASISLESLTLGNLLSSGSKAFSIGPELNMPLLDGGANKAKVKQAEAKHREAIAVYRGTVITAMKEMEDALTNQRSYAMLVERNRTGTAATTKTAALSLERYTQGLINFLEVAESQREELQAQRSLLQSQGNRLLASVQLMKSLGVGWAK
jgi:multidrug efflux system outer membrane protein